jgi:ribonuclease P protein component
MRFSVTLKKDYEFRRLYSKGKSAVTPVLVVYCRKNGRGYNQIGITVSNKIGKAVYRNKIRRRIREIYRLHEDQLAVGYTIVVVARIKSRYTSYWELEKAYLGACSRLGILRGESEEGGKL